MTKTWSESYVIYNDFLLYYYDHKDCETYDHKLCITKIVEISILFHFLYVVIMNTL